MRIRQELKRMRNHTAPSCQQEMKVLEENTGSKREEESLKACTHIHTEKLNSKSHHLWKKNFPKIAFLVSTIYDILFFFIFSLVFSTAYSYL